MNRLLPCTALLALALAGTAQAATSATVVIQSGPRVVSAAPVLVQPPPPPPRYEAVPRARRGMVWSQGHWEWRRHAYVWVPGQWVRLRRGHAYHQPYWQQRGSQWIFVEGGWGERPGHPRHGRDRY